MASLIHGFPPREPDRHSSEWSHVADAERKSEISSIASNTLARCSLPSSEPAADYRAVSPELQFDESMDSQLQRLFDAMNLRADSASHLGKRVRELNEMEPNKKTKSVDSSSEQCHLRKREREVDDLGPNKKAKSVSSSSEQRNLGKRERELDEMGPNKKAKSVSSSENSHLGKRERELTDMVPNKKGKKAVIVQEEPPQPSQLFIRSIDAEYERRFASLGKKQTDRKSLADRFISPREARNEDLFFLERLPPKNTTDSKYGQMLGQALLGNPDPWKAKLLPTSKMR